MVFLNNDKLENFWDQQLRVADYSTYFIIVYPHRNTHHSSVVTLSRPPPSLSLRITDRSFRYVLPWLWNQLPVSLRQPRTNLSTSDSDLPSPSINSPLSSSITRLLFYSRLKTRKPFLPTWHLSLSQFSYPSRFPSHLPYLLSTSDLCF